MPDPENGGFEVFVETETPGLVRRFFTTYRHFLGLALGGLRAYVRVNREVKDGFVFFLLRMASAFSRPFVDRELTDQPFPTQLRRRLEILGPTYIKLGQILSLREDILPASVTDELKNLLDRLPAVPFPRFVELVEEDLGRPADEVFTSIEQRPIGSASIGQIHLARLKTDEVVVIKTIKPGIRQIVQRDVVLLRILGWILQRVLGRFQPQKVIKEFCTYTLREVDLRLEADNAETFTANFKDRRLIVFPRIYRDFSGPNVLVMEFFDGVKPSAKEAKALPHADREKIIDTGAEAIVRMLYRDGFFHADLHPGNLLILPGAKCGFIDLGMVGRFDDQLRRSLLYYYYCLVIGDAENAARYLTSVAEAGPASDPEGFRKDVEEISRRWSRTANFDEFSLGQLIMESVGKGGRYYMYFPVDMVLMVKALITFEGVGQLLMPNFDVAGVSKKHITKIFMQQFSPFRLVKESLRGAPELVDALVKAPMLITEGLKVLEQTTKQPAQNPFSGLRGTLFGGFCMVAGAILATTGGPTWLSASLFITGIYLAIRSGG